MKLIKVLAFLMIASSAQAGLITQQKSGCTNYKTDNTIERGTEGDNILTDKTVHGMYLKDMVLDFKADIASFELKAAIIFGFNPVLNNGSRVFISKDHPGLQEFVNLYQKDFFFFEEVCVAANGEVIDFKVVETE